MSIDLKAPNVTAALDGFLQRKAVIENDPYLSPAGKEASIKQVDAQRAAYASKSYTDFAGDWEKVKRENARLIGQRQAAAEAAAKQWDTARLTYERQTATGQVMSAGTPEDVQKQWEAVKLSGDRHAMRAYSETAASMIGGVKQFSDVPRAVNVKTAMQREADRLKDTPELKAQRDAESNFTKQVADLYDATRQASNALYPDASAATFGVGNPFMDLTKGVKVTRKVNADLVTITSVDFDEE